jgi:hypothetical protein
MFDGLLQLLQPEPVFVLRRGQVPAGCQLQLLLGLPHRILPPRHPVPGLHFQPQLSQLQRREHLRLLLWLLLPLPTPVPVQLSLGQHSGQQHHAHLRQLPHQLLYLRTRQRDSHLHWVLEWSPGCGEVPDDLRDDRDSPQRPALQRLQCQLPDLPGLTLLLPYLQ